MVLRLAVDRLALDEDAQLALDIERVVNLLKLSVRLLLGEVSDVFRPHFRGVVDIKAKELQKW